MQNPSNVVRSGRTFISQTSSHKGSRGKSSRNPREVKGSPVKAEELRGQEKTGNKFQPRRFRVSQGFTHPRNSKISDTRKVGPSVHWTVPSSEKVGAVAYRLELPEEMSDIHPVFHVSQLRRCLKVPEAEHVPIEAIDL